MSTRPLLYSYTYLHIARQTALERQDLSSTYFAHHELASKFIILLYLQAGSRLGLLLSVVQHDAVFSGQHLKRRQVGTRSAIFDAVEP